MTLLAIYLTQGGSRARHFIFPIVFFMVAVPWPTPVEDAVIQTLTRFNASLVVEVLSFAGVPALARGNVIEISTGMVGIDEACSGIRSFQATLMVALFLGAFYRLGRARRWWLLGAGPALALAFNFTRMLVLVLVAAHSGLPAMERWHDPTGVALLVGCFLGLWGVAVWMARKEQRTASSKQREEIGNPCAETSSAGGRRVEGRNRKSEIGNQKLPVSSPLPVKAAWADSPGRLSVFQHSGISVITLSAWVVVWALMVEVSTEAWFRSHEARGVRTIDWTVQWPVENHVLRTNLIPDTALRLLQCDQNTTASWTDENDVFWQAFYLRWRPANSFYGRTKVAMSKTHNPTICLPAAGLNFQAQLEPVSLTVRPGFDLTFDRYVFTIDDRKLYVFFSQMEDLQSGGPASLRGTSLARLDAALAGSRNYGQINFEVAIAGPATPDAALRLFSDRLPDLVTIRPSEP